MRSRPGKQVAAPEVVAGSLATMLLTADQNGATAASPPIIAMRSRPGKQVAARRFPLVAGSLATMLLTAGQNGATAASPPIIAMRSRPGKQVAAPEEQCCSTSHP